MSLSNQIHKIHNSSILDINSHTPVRCGSRVLQVNWLTIPRPISMQTDLFQTPHSRWLALRHRTPSSHSSFLYGVKSTKIYCRPTCPARLARRANIVFYNTEDEARRDGFRPCKRCKPDDAAFAGASEEVVTKVIALLRVERNELTMNRSLKDLAKEVGVTPSYLCRVFKNTMGVTVGTYMKEFEKEAGERQAENSVQPFNEFGSAVVGDKTEFLTPQITVNDPRALVQGLHGGSTEEGVENLREAPDFNLDEWVWTKSLNDSVYG